MSDLPWSEFNTYREVTAYPGVLELERFDLRSLWAAAERAEVLFRGWPFIFVDARREKSKGFSDRIETEVDHSFSHTQFERWELHRNGFFFHKELMDEATWDDAKRLGDVIDVDATVYHTGEAVASLWRLYAALNVPDDEELTIEFTYTGMQGRVVAVVDIMKGNLFGVRPCKEPSVTKKVTKKLGEWRRSDAALAGSIVSDLLQMMGWEDPNDTAIQRRLGKFLAKPQFEN
jgi:hypothetical protein